MEMFKSQSNSLPKSLVIEQRMIDVNEDIVEETITDEEGNTFTQYFYTTYRFRNYAEYTAWLNERKEKEITSLQEENDLLGGCVMELTQIISDMMEAME